MVRIANQVRKLFLGENGEDGQISVTMSTRTLVRWAKLSLAFRGAPNALEYAWIKLCLSVRPKRSVKPSCVLRRMCSGTNGAKG